MAEGLLRCHVCYSFTSPVNDSNAVATSNQDTNDENNKATKNTNSTEDTPEITSKTAEASDVMGVSNTDPAVVEEVEAMEKEILSE